MSSFAFAKAPDLCGLLFYDDWWFNTGGYAYLTAMFRSISSIIARRRDTS